MKLHSSLLHCCGALALAAGSMGCEKETTPKPEPTVSENRPAEGTQAKSDRPAEAKPGAKSDLADIAAQYDVDPVHSSVVFHASHFDVSNVYGMIPQVTGTLNIDKDPSKSEVSLQFDPASVYTAVEKRDDHLKSPDFLDVKQFPKAEFKSTKVKTTDDDRFEVTGDLTLHGTTKPVTITMKQTGAARVQPMDNSFRVGFEGEVTIDRAEFGMTKLPDAVGKQVHLTVAVEAVRK